jgi:hypothetical protein
MTTADQILAIDQMVKDYFKGRRNIVNKRYHHV